MKNKIYILVILMLLTAVFAAPVRADSVRDREYKVKAAFVYNFIKFIDFPKEKGSAGSKAITIGIVGSGDFLNAFDPIKSKQIKGKKIVLKQFNGYDNLKELQKKKDPKWKEILKSLKECQVLFICTCENEKKEIPVELLKALKDSGVLVIGEVPGLLKNGGVINFIMENKKVRFEINVKVAEHNGLKIRSQLLKLAKRVIKNGQHKETKD